MRGSFLWTTPRTRGVLCPPTSALGTRTRKELELLELELLELEPA